MADNGYADRLESRYSPCHTESRCSAPAASAAATSAWSEKTPGAEIKVVAEPNEEAAASWQKAPSRGGLRRRLPPCPGARRRPRGDRGSAPLAPLSGRPRRGGGGQAHIHGEAHRGLGLAGGGDAGGGAAQRGQAHDRPHPALLPRGQGDEGDRRKRRAGAGDHGLRRVAQVLWPL